MREKIIEILKEENKKMNPVDILGRIKSKNTAEDLRNIILELDDMCREGILRTGSGNTYFFNDLITGVLDVHDKGNAHLLMKDGEDIYIRSRNLKGACDKDTVSVEIINEKTNEGRVVKVLKKGLGKSFGEVVNDNGNISIKIFDELPYKIEFEDTDINLVDGMLVHFDYVRDIDKNRVLARIDKVLGHKNALVNETGESTKNAEEIAKIACEYNIPLEFSEEALEEAKNMPKSLNDKMLNEGINEGREDFRNDIIFTIDGKDTKDIDDAISIKILPNGNYSLGVHIADVSHYVKEGSALWKEAESRGNSNYLGNKVIPMLPIELSNGICSLNPNEDRFTESCIMEIDHSGKVVDYKVCKGIIRSRKKMNYDAVEDIIEGRDTEDTKDYTTLEYIVKKGDTKESIGYENNMSPLELDDFNKECKYNVGDSVNIPVSKIINSMHSLSKELSAFKKRRGELSFESDEAYIKMDENDEVYDIVPRIQRDAEKLIESFMVVANECIASYLTGYEIATYRIHEEPLQKKIEDYMKFLELAGIHYPIKIDPANITSMDCQKLLDYLRGEKAFRVLNKKLLRSMQKARYSTENAGHFGIASPCYTHFTSPIRRIDDLLNHTSISKILKEKNMSKQAIDSWNAYLTYVCDTASENERNSEKCEYAVDDMLKADYMTHHIGEEFEGTIEDMFNSAFFVQTDNYIDGRVEFMMMGEDEIPVIGYYQYNEDLMAYTRNNRVDLRYGDRVVVKCTAADPETREIDFTLVRKV